MTKSIWAERTLALDDIPPAIRNSARYADRDYWLENAQISLDGRCIRLLLDADGSDTQLTDYWCLLPNGKWDYIPKDTNGGIKSK